MSATRDRSQKIKLVVSNDRSLHSEKQNQCEVRTSLFAEELKSKDYQAHVIKAEDLKKHQIRQYQDQSLTSHSSSEQMVQSKAHGHCPRGALEGLKQNLKNLNDLHSKLRFMLKELEELVID
jgi:hypothetical protein